MKRSSLVRATAVAFVSAAVMVVGSGIDISGEPDHLPAGGIHWARGEAQAGRGGRSPNLVYHGGAVMHGTAVTPIFWGTSWNNDSQNKIGWINTFYTGMNASSYAGSNTEYTDGAGHVSTAISVSPGVVDLSAVSANGQQTGPILAEACKAIPTPVANGYYPVYTDQKRGQARFCAWHSAGTCGGVTVQFAFFFNLDGDAGCDPGSAVPDYSQGVAALANVSGHELSEALTDRHLDAWFDSSGSENADKCAWTFGHSSLAFSDGHQWKVQGNWSNAAFSTNSGYPNSSGQRGCID